MGYTTYSVIHLLGIVLMMLALGGILAHVANGGTKDNNNWRKKLGMLHGIGLFLSLLGGFGMLAKLSLGTWPLWIIIKMIVWLILGAAPAVIYRNKLVPIVALLSVITFALIAIVAVNLKPII